MSHLITDHLQQDVIGRGQGVRFWEMSGIDFYNRLPFW